MSAQDDGGATFKQFINHKGTLTWEQFSYQPGEGHKSGTYSPPTDFAFANALTLVLRGFPHETPENFGREILEDARSNALSADKPTLMSIRYLGTKKVELPIGEVEAFGLHMTDALLGGKQVTT